MKPQAPRVLLLALEHSGALLFAVILVTFGILQPRFLAPENLVNILLQSSATAIVAIGMTFVLVTAGVDLSVGALMFIGASIAGRMALAGGSPLLVLPWMVGVGVIGGALNALLVTRLGILAFIATLGTLNAGRGLGLWISQTRAMNLPDSFARLGAERWLGIPLPLLVLGILTAIAHGVLQQTPFGRQLLAMGQNPEAARKAGIPVRRHLAAAYMISGGCAGLGGVVALTQLGAVSPRFGEFYEFDAITAAVLGGTSLFGGRGNIFPGALLGAVLVKSIFNGLVMLQADPYLFPMITSVIIFIAVLFDSLRRTWIARLRTRTVLPPPAPSV